MRVSVQPLARMFVRRRPRNRWRALELNKRMELKTGSHRRVRGLKGGESPRPLLQFALSAEVAWACTTCGACMEVCPTQNEQMLDIIDIRRQQVMMEGEFPTQLQTAFRGMDAANNPWGIGQVGRSWWCRRSRRIPIPMSSTGWVARPAMIRKRRRRLGRLCSPKVNFAVLGEKECCTGDTARRAGAVSLYRQLADQNVATLTTVQQS